MGFEIALKIQGPVAQIGPELNIRDPGSSDIGKMMGQHEGQKELFSYGVDLERRVRADHPLRRVQAMTDFTFARAAVAHTYDDNGQVSVDSVVLLEGPGSSADYVSIISWRWL